MGYSDGNARALRKNGRCFVWQVARSIHASGKSRLQKKIIQVCGRYPVKRILKMFYDAAPLACVEVTQHSELSMCLHEPTGRYHVQHCHFGISRISVACELYVINAELLHSIFCVF